MYRLNPCDAQALDKVVAVEPVLKEYIPARNLHDGNERIIFHAGPPFASPRDITVPILNSACVASVFEGFAESFSDAKTMIEQQQIYLKPAQDYNIVVPLAGVVSSSMWLYKVVDINNPENIVYAPLNGGNGPAMRLGLCNSDVLDHLHWLNSELIQFFLNIPIEVKLLPIAAFAIAHGDDCHGRTVAGTNKLIERWLPALHRHPAISDFLKGSPMFFLNLWMAACKCMLMSAAGINNSSVVVAAGGNGREIGIQIAGKPKQWFIASAAPPDGDLGSYPAKKALGAIGDSAIVDAAGFGAMAISYAPEQLNLLGEFLPEDALSLPEKLLPRVHPEFGDLNFRTGLCARTVVDTKTTPIVGLGILDKEGIVGRLGGGISRYPMQIFDESLAGLD